MLIFVTREIELQEIIKNRIELMVKTQYHFFLVYVRDMIIEDDKIEVKFDFKITTSKNEPLRNTTATYSIDEFKDIIRDWKIKKLD